MSDLVGEHLDEIREGQVEDAFEQGSGQSKEQNTRLRFHGQYVLYTRGDEPTPESVDDHETVGEQAEELCERLRDVRLENADEDRILREMFRHSGEHDLLTEWPVEAFLIALQELLNEHILISTKD